MLGEVTFRRSAKLLNGTATRTVLPTLHAQPLPQSDQNGALMRNLTTSLFILWKCISQSSTKSMFHLLPHFQPLSSHLRPNLQVGAPVPRTTQAHL